MIIDKSKKAFLIIGSVVLPVITAGAIFVGSKNAINRSDASAYSSTLNSSRKPTLSGGNGSLIDDKSVTWEYHNALDNPSGHISLQHQGYFGVASASTWGYTNITNVTINFTAGSLGELWLLKSVNGVDWHDAAILKNANDSTSSSVSSTEANDWRYIRFYFYDSTGNETIDINSVSINYGCESQLSGPEQIDAAHPSNVTAVTNLSYASETSTISPRSIGGEAVRFTKIDSSKSTDITISLGNNYRLGDFADSKIEFDIWTERVAYGKTIEVLFTNGSISTRFTAGSGLHDTNITDCYVWTSLGNNWYHAELPISTMVSLISGYDKQDIPSASLLNKEFNAIKINAGSCVIDNLRIGRSATELGIYNNASYKPKVGDIYWVKTSWSGILHAKEVTITFDDNSLARRISLTDQKLINGSPFYIELLGSGNLKITVNVVCGFNHTTKTTERTITIQ